MNKNNPLVTCIIPTKNRPDLLLRAIKSVYDQTYNNIEIIVIDDSTNDLAYKLLSDSALDLKYIKNEKSRGAPYSRNIGLSEAKGDVISFLDDDDFWMPEKIESQMNLLPHYPIVSCNYISTCTGKKKYIRRPKVITYEDMLYYNYLGSCSFLLIDASVMKGHYFDENLMSGQDWDIILSVMKQNHIKEAGIASGYLVDYSDDSYPRISNNSKSIKGILRIYEKYHADHNALTTQLFSLYSVIPANNSPVIWFLRELTKAKLKKKTVGFFLKALILRIFGRINIY